LEKYASILVENGYKVAVVEQTESKREMDVRI
jgi:DNA mismatch repair ATPase MutS